MDKKLKSVHIKAKVAEYFEQLTSSAHIITTTPAPITLTGPSVTTS